MYERIRTDSILSFLDRTNNQQDKEREGGGAGGPRRVVGGSLGG